MEMHGTGKEGRRKASIQWILREREREREGGGDRYIDNVKRGGSTREHMRKGQGNDGRLSERQRDLEREI